MAHTNSWEAIYAMVNDPEKGAGEKGGGLEAPDNLPDEKAAPDMPEKKEGGKEGGMPEERPNQ